MTISIKRRRFVGQLGGLAAASTGSGVLGCRSETKGSGVSIRDGIAEKVKAIQSSRGATLRLLYPKGCLANLRPVVETFQRLTELKVELREANLTEVSAEVLLENRLAKSGARFDVAIPATFALPDLVESGALCRLDEFAEAHAPSNLGASSIYQLGDRYKGKLYGYQADGDAYVMFYNKTWQQDAREQEAYQQRYSTSLKVPQTWEELDRQMAFFQRPESQRFGGSLFRNLDYMAWEFWVRFHSKGYFPVARDMSPQINSPAGQAALGELVAASASQEPAARTNGLFANFNSFSQGNKYCNLGWGGTQKFLAGDSSSVRGKLAFGAVPGGVIQGELVDMPYFNWGWNYVVSSRSEIKETAYLFALFASTPAESTRSVGESAGYFDPHREEHYADPQIQEIYGSEFLKVHRASLEHCIPDFYLRGQGDYLAALRRGVFAAERGYLCPQEALDQVAAKWNRITDRFGRDEQAKQWSFLRDSYPKRLQELLT